MTNQTQTLIQRLGETDQAYLEQNSPELALERGQLRNELAKFSRNKQEKLYFLNEAVIILEQARVEFEEMPMSLYLSLSLALSDVYLHYFSIDASQKYAIIAEQILKPLAHHNHPDIFANLQRACQHQNKLALARHWQQKATPLISQTRH